ncbi:MAG TPA: right-handed parallel beta-helix repeat-containing protein [Actinomycetota bacterium]
MAKRRPLERLSTPDPRAASDQDRTFALAGDGADRVRSIQALAWDQDAPLREASTTSEPTEASATDSFSAGVEAMSVRTRLLGVEAAIGAEILRTGETSGAVADPGAALLLRDPLPEFSDPPLPASPTGGVYGPPNVASNCSIDVSAQLNTWMASIPDNSTIIFEPDGCYLVQDRLSLTDRRTLLIDGQGSLFRRTELSTGLWLEPNTGGNRHWRFYGGSDITVRNIAVEGTNIDDPNCSGVVGAEYGAPGYACYVVNMEFEHGMSFHGIQGLRVDNVQTISTWGDGLYFGPYQGLATKNATITNVQIDLNGRQGIALSGADSILFDDVSILHSRRAGFDLEPPPSYVRNIEIRNSYINSFLLAFASAGRGDVSNIYIHHNTIDASGIPLVYVNASDGTRRYNWRIEYNTSLRPRGSPQATMLFSNVTGVIVRGNTWPVHTTQSRKAVEFRGALGTLIVLDNDFTGACWAYNRDATTSGVFASNNVISTKGC